MIRIPQLPGDAGIVQTATLMRAYVNQAIDHPLVRKQAVLATRGCERGDIRCQALSIGEWVRGHIQYVPDPRNNEQLTTPALMASAIDQGLHVYGDCDDMSMYAAALAKSIGLQPTFQIVGKGARFHHVYITVNGIAVDPTVNLGTAEFRGLRRMPVLV